MKPLSLFVFVFIFSFSTWAQQEFTAYKGGHEFNVSIPSYMTRTTGLNSSAILQFKNLTKDIYVVIIEDDKEEMKLADLDFASIDDFHEYSMKSFLKDEEQRSISEPLKKSVKGFNYIETDASYYDRDVKTSIYYLYGIVETKTRFYKVLSFTSLDNKEKYKGIFQQILYSLHD